MYRLIVSLGICAIIASCKVPAITAKGEPKPVPGTYSGNPDSTNFSSLQWGSYFTDPYLVSLIDKALRNNQELMITLQEIEIARNDIRVKKGELLPKVDLGVGGGVEKVGRYTSQGAGDATTEIYPGKEMPDPLGDITIAARASWEIDIWKKLRNGKKAAITRYLATIEGRNFVLTNLIAEVANSYYELLALDNQLEIVRQNISLQIKYLLNYGAVIRRELKFWLKPNYLFIGLSIRYSAKNHQKA